MTKPITTLFLLESLDGKISTGDVDELDVDKDFRRIAGIKEGLAQYYALEKQTDRVSFDSGRVLAKVGANTWSWKKSTKQDIEFVVVDNKPHLNEKGCEYFAKRSQAFYVVTTNAAHPALGLQKTYPNIHILFYKSHVDFVDVFRQFKEKFGMKRVTVQTGGTINAELLRLKLIDFVSIVVAPCLIGGAHTQSLIGGVSLHTQADLKLVKALNLIQCDTLEHSYLHLKYEVINETVIETGVATR